ncbi:YkgJ family cysteine cluster protein [Methanoregula sp.]|uniref:YkgJ family cysteine cluster protein n=1 Tax=Methanoregula sp. TaxID=2052170 RepID=UPI002C59A26C|nr:YkgJ family cysteine cluster protein [Methanoregula sp.]HVP97196.1 YkgJ family cysteine cluster protein [Methanoregula sp.]
MVSFVCDHCGKCCTSIGAYIKIERQLSEQDYYCKNTITGEVFPVHVAPEFAEEIDEDFASGSAASRPGCIFQRRNPNGPGQVCAIYPTRPRLCREFRCYHMVIFNPMGQSVGRMVGRTDIQTSDPVLARLWNEEVKPQPGPATPCSDPAWVSRVCTILAGHGYRGEMVEGGNR